jgi:PleD family two-component response regulator
MSRILVVDDDLDILVVMEILLTMKGFEVEVTAKWENTFEKVETFKPELILLDVLISGNDGRTICKQLKAQDETKDIPIIMFLRIRAPRQPLLITAPMILLQSLLM